MQKTRILVVDDSSFIRMAITKSLEVDPEIEVVGTAPNGRVALSKVVELHPDLITLDVDMPEMDGLATLRELRRMRPQLPVIMCSSLTQKGAVATLDALALGAACYVTKPTHSGSMEESMTMLRNDLLPKIKALVGHTPSERRAYAKNAAHAPSADPTIATPSPSPTRRLSRRKNSQKLKPAPTPITAPPPVATAVTSPASSHHHEHAEPIPQTPHPRVDIVVIGVSTGGPNALATLLPNLPKDFPVPIAIVQHMPAVFTKLIAERLDASTSLKVCEAQDGDTLLPGGVWLAPGNFHMRIERENSEYKVRLNQDPPEHFCRPSVNVLFRSAAEIFGPNTLAVILTGMGSDGTEGCQKLHEIGAQIIVQDESTSVVWGMPGSVAEHRLAEAILPIDQIAQEIIKRVSQHRNP